ncbi:MAG: carbohydrate binding family 9 domain-containing protein [Candidatus Eisenbacteria bacterium]|nr:carbohydrate binding family 9 domain-containing protein [Candidatus Eisenbacteria bacterium]
MSVDLVSRITAARLLSPIRLDGALDEESWQRPAAAPLVQNEPDNGCTPRQDTEWWVVYDDEALYIGCRMLDSQPDSIVCGLGRRDAYPVSDWIYLNLDTFNDDRNGYSFSFSPAGSMNDAVIYCDGATDDSWDGIWDVAARVDDGGWSAEVRIPFAQLAFPDAEEQVWGMNFSRRICRYQERDELFHRPRGESGYVGRFPDLVGIRGVKPGKRVEVLAYGAGKADFTDADGGDPFRDGSDWSGNTGADILWGLSNDLNLNATFNPDFGQVEVDPAVVNLGDFETYFPEKRPFFVKDSGVFRFAREGTNNNWNFNWMDPMLFYSRRIGRTPTLSLGDNDYADAPEATTILGAGKMSGKIGDNTIGLLHAVTAREEARLEYEGIRSEQTVEPLAGYTVARLSRTTANGDHGVGWMLTDVRRDLDDPRGREELTGAASAIGMDGWTTLDDDGVWALRGYLSGSRVTGSSEAIDEVQRNSRHYMDRPCADHLDYDPNRTRLDGWSGRLMLNKQSGAFTLNTAVGVASPGYEIGDLGYQTRSDKINSHLVLSYAWHEPRGVFRNRAISLGTYKLWDYGGAPDNYGSCVFWSAGFRNFWEAWGNVFYEPERTGRWTTWGGPPIRLPRHRSAEAYLESDGRGVWTVGGGGRVWDIADGSRGASAEMWFTIRPRSGLRLFFDPYLSWGHDKVGWVGTEEDSTMTDTYGSRYLFADFTERRFMMTTRLDWTFTPGLTLQTYIQPLFAAARYRDIKELSRPNSYDCNVYGRDNGSTIVYSEEDGAYEIDPDGAGPIEAYSLDDPDFNFKSLKLNMVLRWEFRPGSTFYLVWTQNRTDEGHAGDFELDRDARNLFGSPGDDIVMAKIATWWNL